MTERMTKKKKRIRKGVFLLLILLAAVGMTACAGKEPETDPIIYDGDGMVRLKDDFPEWARATYVAADAPRWSARLDGDRLTLFYDGEEIASTEAYAVLVPEDPEQRVGDAVMDTLTLDWPDGDRGSCMVVSMRVVRGELTLVLLFDDGNTEVLTFTIPEEEEYPMLPDGVTVKAIKFTRYLDYVEPCFSIRDEGDRVVLRMTPDELYWPDTDPEAEEYTDPQAMDEGTVVSREQWDEFCRTIILNGVLAWDGFEGVREEDPELEMLDGDESFRMTMLFSDGTLIRAHGDQSFPENYDAVVTAILELEESFGF